MHRVQAIARDLTRHIFIYFSLCVFAYMGLGDVGKLKVDQVLFFLHDQEQWHISVSILISISIQISVFHVLEVKTSSQHCRKMQKSVERIASMCTNLFPYLLFQMPEVYTSLHVSQYSCQNNNNKYVFPFLDKKYIFPIIIKRQVYKKEKNHPINRSKFNIPPKKSFDFLGL